MESPFPVRYREADGSAKFRLLVVCIYFCLFSILFSGSQGLEDLKPYLSDSFSARILDVNYLLPLKCTDVLSGIQKENRDHSFWDSSG